MLCNIFALLTLVGVAHSACYNTSVIYGMVGAICTDEVTGFHFQFLPWKGDHTLGSLPVSKALTPKLLSNMYTAYRSGIKDYDTPPKSPSISNTLEGFWVRCYAKLEGVCANDHRISWYKGRPAYRDLLTRLLHATQGQRMNHNPRAVCTSADGLTQTFCVQWAYNHAASIPHERIQVATAAVTQDCQVTDYSAEFKTQVDLFGKGEKKAIQYYCVSNRATGCVKNSELHHCKNLPGYSKD